MSSILDKDADLDRQMKAVRRGETDVVICPWCGIASDAESGDCCINFSEAKDRIATEHLKLVVARFKSVRNGLADSVQCPYCDEINRWENFESPAHWKRPGINPYCCDTLALAVVRVGDHSILQDRIDHMRRIQDNLAKASCN